MRVMEIPTIRENMSFIGVLFEDERVVPEKQKSGLRWLRLGITLLPRISTPPQRTEFLSQDC